MRKTLSLLLMASLIAVSQVQAQTQDEKELSFLEENPHLKEMIYQPPRSNFYIGFGLSPVGFVRDQMLLSANLFEVHWMGEWAQWEIIKASFGQSLGGQESAGMTQFALRSAPKIQITDMLSFGPVVGYEFVSMKEAKVIASKDSFSTPSEPFSASSYIYGFSLNQDFALGKDYKLKVGEVVYWQNYSSSKNSSGWDYQFVDPELNADRSSIDADMVILLEVSILY